MVSQKKKKKEEAIIPFKIFFLLDVNFVKSTIGLHFLFIFSMFAKFWEDQRFIAMSSCKYLNFKFL